MKDLKTGELSGPPLEHDEWVKRQQELDAEALKQQSKKAGTRAAASSDETQGDGLDDLTVAELKERAKAAGLDGYSTLNKQELIDALSK